MQLVKQMIMFESKDAYFFVFPASKLPEFFERKPNTNMQVILFSML